VHAADTNAELLSLMQEQGDDLAVPRDVDFFVIFETRPPAEAFAGLAAAALEMPASISPYEKTDKWQVSLTRHMVPDLAQLNQLEKRIAALARQHGGEADGWGCPHISRDRAVR
jgi:hypothetical protein